MEPRSPAANQDMLLLTPSPGPNFFGGIGFLVMGGALAYLAIWAGSGAQNQRGNHAALCAQLGDRAYKYDFCKPNAGSALEGLSVLPAFLAFVLIAVGGYWLYRSLVNKDRYVFDRRADELRRNDVVISPLNVLETVTVGRYGRSFTLELDRTDGDSIRLSTYLTRDEAMEEAERVASYLGIPVD